MMIVGMIASLILLLCCAPQPRDNSPMGANATPQRDDTEQNTIPATSQPPAEPNVETRCCRWQNYVVDGGGGQTGLAVNPNSPNIVYATTDNGGIIKSTDYGDTWQTINNNIGHTRLAEVKLDPLNPDILYVSASPCMGCGQGELYRSLDGGKSWTFITSVFGVEKWPSARGMLIIPQDADGDQVSDVILIGAWAGNKGGNKGGIWRSVDEGVSWEQIGQINNNSEIIKQANVWVLRRDPASPDILYAGMYVYRGTTTIGGILKSTDGGLSWTDITHNIPVPAISDIAIAPDSKTLYAATNAFYRPEAGAGIYKSDDGGENWFPINHGLEKTSLKFQVLLMDQQDPDVLYAGPVLGDAKSVYKTTDGGRHWHRSRFDHSDWWGKYFGNSWAITQGADDKLYIATWQGIYRSDDDGETWLIRAAGLGNIIVYDVAIDPQTPSTLYLGLGDIGPWKSTDGGKTWSRIHRGYYEPYGRGTGGVNAFAISPSDPHIIYSAVRGSSGTTLMGVNKTTNGGHRWSAINHGLPGPDPTWQATDIAVHPHTPDIAYVALKTEGNTGYIFKTTDGGQDWEELSVTPNANTPRVESLAISNSDPETILAGTREPGRVYKTSDGGASWNLISPPEAMMETNTIVYTIDIHPHNPDHIVIGINTQGAYKTVDGGASWIKILDPTLFQNHMGDLALNPETPIHATIKAIRFDPDNPQVIYAGHDNRGAGGFGILKSSDGGTSWEFINDAGLQYRNTFALDINPQTKELVIGGFNGVYIYERYIVPQQANTAIDASEACAASACN